MTLQELRNQALLESGIAIQAAAPEQMAEIDQLLNRIQLVYGARWKVPRFSDAQTGFTAATYTLTNVPYTDGLLSFRDDTNGRILEILRREEADREYPDRASWGTGEPKFVEYDATNPGVLTFWPAPTTGFDFTVFYAGPPTPMELGTDQPWNGQFPEWHTVIAKRAALQLAATRIGNFDSNDAPTATYTILRSELRRLEDEVEAQLMDFGIMRYPDWWGLTKI